MPLDSCVQEAGEAVKEFRILNCEKPATVSAFPACTSPDIFGFSIISNKPVRPRLQIIIDSAQDKGCRADNKCENFPQDFSHLYRRI